MYIRHWVEPTSKIRRHRVTGQTRSPVPRPPSKEYRHKISRAPRYDVTAHACQWPNNEFSISSGRTTAGTRQNRGGTDEGPKNSVVTARVGGDITNLARAKRKEKKTRCESDYRGLRNILVGGWEVEAKRKKINKRKIKPNQDARSTNLNTGFAVRRANLANRS